LLLEPFMLRKFFILIFSFVLASCIGYGMWNLYELLNIESEFISFLVFATCALSAAFIVIGITDKMEDPLQIL